MSEVTLIQILDARERRVRRQQALLETHHCTLISFTMNIAGPVKTGPAIERAFSFGLARLHARLPADAILAEECLHENTGCEALLAVRLPADNVKSISMQIEEETPLGRLFDMDVIAPDGAKVDRPAQRGCIVCGAPGRGCAARRAHSVPELQAATQGIIGNHFRESDADRIAALAVRSLIDEVHTTPKPGLVDERNNGSHRDMTLSTFEASARALEGYFRNCLHIGQDTAALTPKKVFPALRAAGLIAEEAMYRATGGVNTHKGAIFTMGILCGVIGRLWSPGCPTAPVSDLLNECSRIYSPFEKTDFTRADSATAGQRLYLAHGLRGIRGEVADGLPAVSRIGLPIFERALAQGHSQNDAGLIALLHLIANVADTNLFHRGGTEGAAYAADYAKRLLALENPLAHMSEMDDAFIARNLSPGGCADLLAVVYFLHSLNTHFSKPFAPK